MKILATMCRIGTNCPTIAQLDDGTVLVQGNDAPHNVVNGLSIGTNERAVIVSPELILEAAQKLRSE